MDRQWAAGEIYIFYFYKATKMVIHESLLDLQVYFLIFISIHFFSAQPNSYK